MRGRNSNYALHTGQLFGLPTQILAFLGSLVAATLPVTGFLIWRGRRRKAPPRVEVRSSARKIAVPSGR